MLKSVSRGLSDLPVHCCFVLTGTQQLRGTLQTIIQTQVHLGLANPDFSHFARQVPPGLETTYKQDQRSDLILVSLWALSPLTVLALMKDDHRMKGSRNPAGTCWEGRERESGRQEVPTEIANTTTCLFCFLGSMANPKVINIWLGWPDKMCPHRILHSPSLLASISAPLKAAPSVVLQVPELQRIQALLE